MKGHSRQRCVWRALKAARWEGKMGGFLQDHSCGRAGLPTVQQVSSLAPTTLLWGHPGPRELGKVSLTSQCSQLHCRLCGELGGTAQVGLHPSNPGPKRSW